MKTFPQSGYFVISLDFELLWGIFDVVHHPEKRQYFEETKKVIPIILEEFEKSKISATWAVVGMLFNKDWEEWRKNIPQAIPSYLNSSLSAYEFVEKISDSSHKESFFAPELIQNIKKIPGQEIGTHTYSHYYCLEPGQKVVHFRKDLEKAIEMGSRKGIALTSLVFPRNQVKEEYLNICRDLGITSVRSNPSSWYWKDTQSEAIVNKIARTGDAYLPLGKKSYSLQEVKQERGVVQQKASRFLRPPENNYLLRRIKIRRIKNEMSLAAKRHEVYHLWWHPHNFGNRPLEAIKDMKEIIEHYVKLNRSQGFQSANMKQIEEIILKNT